MGNRPRRYLQEDGRLYELAGPLSAQTCALAELGAQRARFLAAQNLADALYDRAMEKLRKG